MLPTATKTVTKSSGRLLVQYGQRRFVTKPLVKLGIHLARLNTLGKLSHRRLLLEDFRRDGFGYQTIWGGSQDPLAALDMYINDPELLLAMAALVGDHDAEIFGHGHTDLLYGAKHHQYFFRSKRYKVPAWAVPFLDDPKNKLPFVDMLSFFPSYGQALGELPVQLASGSYGPIVTRGLRSPDKVLARIKQIKETGAIDGLFALADSSTIALSNFKVVSNPRYVVRAGMASTSPDHVFDGAVGWTQQYDRQKQELSFAGGGAGLHVLPPLDGLNSLMGGFVFATMIRTYLLALHVQAERAQAGLPPLELLDAEGWYSPGARTVREQLSRDPDLLNCWVAAHMLDQVGRVASGARWLTGGNVVGPPPKAPAKGTSGTKPTVVTQPTVVAGPGEWSGAWPLLSLKVDVTDNEHEAAEEATADAPPVVEEIEQEGTTDKGTTDKAPEEPKKKS